MATLLTGSVWTPGTENCRRGIEFVSLGVPECMKIERLSRKIMFWQKDASSIHQGFEIYSVLHYTQTDYFLDHQVKEILLNSTFQLNESNIYLPFLMLPKRGVLAHIVSISSLGVINYNRSVNALAGSVELQGQCWCLTGATPLQTELEKLILVFFFTEKCFPLVRM